MSSAIVMFLAKRRGTRPKGFFMQVMQASSSAPQRLACGGCHHWEQIAADARTDADVTGRCDRFGDMRSASARPRCNICWEPALVPPIQSIALADG